MVVDATPMSRLSRAALGIPNERERFGIQRDLVLAKVNRLLLPLMRRHQIDMWITLDREYNPDPFAPEIGGEGGVRNAYIFFDTGERLEKIFIFSHPPRDDLAPKLYDQLVHYGYRPEGLRPYLAEAVQKRLGDVFAWTPQIGVPVLPLSAAEDTAQQLRRLLGALPSQLGRSGGHAAMGAGLG